MHAPISIIIPCLNSAPHLGPCLAALWQGFEAGLVREVIFADGGSSDDIAQIAEETGARLVKSNAGRGVQLAAGAQAAKGDWLFFVHSDTVLSHAWPAILRDHVSQSGKPAYGRLRFDAMGFAPRLVASWANLRSRLFGLPYGDQTLLIKRSQYHQAGGYPAVALMEDVALARKLRGQLRMLNFEATTRADRYQRNGWVRQSLRNFGTLCLYFAGRDPAELRKRYER